jgi:ATP-dependent Lon protease
MMQGAARALPLLPLRDIIVFPHMVVPLFVGREKSIAAIDEAMKRATRRSSSRRRSAKTNDALRDDIFEVGTVGVITSCSAARRHGEGAGGGPRRARIVRWIDHEAPSSSCEVEPLDETFAASVEVEALMRSVQSTFETYVKLNKRVRRRC